MARKVHDVTIAADGRDFGKVFRVTEMSALRAEKWAIRALQVLVRAGVQLPDTANEAPAAELVRHGLLSLANAPFSDVEPLLDEMLGCVTIIPDPARPTVVRKLIDGDIEEPVTLFTLRREVLDIHLGFFTAG